MLDKLTTVDFASPIDPAMLIGISFAVVADAVPIPFDHCVANVSVIKR